MAKPPDSITRFNYPVSISHRVHLTAGHPHRAALLRPNSCGI